MARISIWFWILVIIFGAGIGLLGNLAFANQKSANQVLLEIHNVYSLDAIFELKCDWDNDIEEFTYHKFIHIPKHKITTISVSKELKHCQIWPKIKIF
jgi:hypothetical protein